MTEDLRGRLTKDGIRIYEDADFAGMHAAGKVAAQILDDIIPFIQPGVTTAELDAKITEMVNDSGSTPAMAHAIAAEIPGARTAIVPALQHLGLMEDPEAFAAPTLDFLKRTLL